MCTSSTAGDITITSSEGWDLGADFEPFIGNYKGGHGGVRRTNLIVPFILYFPNKKAEKPAVMRSDEVGQMTIKWLLDTDNTSHE